MAREAAARGQTVFLSSNILDEVEGVCDRVAILRAGRLVEVAALADLRRLRSTTLEAIVDGPVPALDGLPGIGGSADGDLIRGVMTAELLFE